MLHEVQNARWVQLTAKQGWLHKLANGEQVPWMDFAVGKQFFGLTVPPGGPRLSVAQWEQWQAAQASTPICFMKAYDTHRHYWWFENKFYWEPDGLRPADVLALVRDKERRKERQLERARTALSQDSQPTHQTGWHGLYGGTSETYVGAHTYDANTGMRGQVIEVLGPELALVRMEDGTTVRAAPAPPTNPAQPASVRRPIPQSVKDEVWRRDQTRCVYCGSQDRLEYDHIIPVSKGGGNTARNIQLLCERCNRSKAASI
jgi:hypothetical protein